MNAYTYDPDDDTVEPAVARAVALRLGDANAALASALRITLTLADGPISPRVRAALPDLVPVHDLAEAESARLYSQGGYP